MPNEPSADKGSVSQQDYGRPEIVISSEEFKGLCRLQCSLKEMASYFECSDDTVENWCKKQFNMTYSECFERFRGKGQISLRRAQYKKAVELLDTGMLKHLGEHWLGQTPKIAHEGELQPIILKYSLDDEKPKPAEEKKSE